MCLLVVCVHVCLFVCVCLLAYVFVCLLVCLFVSFGWLLVHDCLLVRSNIALSVCVVLEMPFCAFVREPLILCKPAISLACLFVCLCV